MRSFRLRLAVVSALLSAAILVAFGIGSWWLIRNAKLGQLDSEMKNLAAREVGQLDRFEVPLEGREAEFATVLGVRLAADVAVLMESQGGEMLYRSSQWPADILSAVTARLNPVSVSKVQELVLPWWPGASAFAAPGRGDGGGPPGGAGGPGDNAWRPGPGPGPVHDGMPVRPRPVGGEGLQPPPRENLAPVVGGARPSPVREQEVEPHTNPVVPLPSPVGATSATDAVPAAPELAVQQLERPLSTPAVPPQEFDRFDAASVPRPPPVVSGFAVTAGGQVWRVAVASLPHRRLVVAANVRAIDDDLRSTRNGFLLVLPVALGLVGLVSWWVAGRALVPLATVTQAARRVTVEGLDRRIEVQGQDREFTELIEVFNRMLARLERSFGQANRFTADAAHELKTPLAIIQGQLERSLVQAQDNPVLQAALTSTLDEVQRLSSISRKLLLLAQADAGRLRVTDEPVDMGQMLSELLEDARMLAPELDIQGRIQADLPVAGDATMLRQVLHNLLSNAIKYNLPGGWIRVQTARWGQRLEVSVSNASHGIAPRERQRLFERFFRADPSHGRKVEGVGLGLSVSREIARAHAGDLVFKGDTSDGGVEFALLLPMR